MDLQAFFDWLQLVFGLAAALAVIVTPLVSLVKTTAGDALSARFYPVISLVVGIVLAQFIALLPLSLTVGPIAFDWRVALLVGPLAGLIASGLFAWGKSSEAAARSSP